MLSITARNVNEAYLIGLMYLRQQGVPQKSRNGNTLEYPDNVSICYTRPQERVLFDAKRNINPFLHFVEPLWIIAGRDDVAPLKFIVPRFAEYSDDGKTFHGAYGKRIRGGVNERDQLLEVISQLRENHDDRRCALMIRRPSDVEYVGKDQPCNIAVTLKIRDDKLNITVYNRSNDFVWGMTGANMPQFSFLQEFIAGAVGVGIGTYHQVTDSCHVYTENDQWNAIKDTPITRCDPYIEPDIVNGLYPAVQAYPLYFGEFSGSGERRLLSDASSYFQILRHHIETGEIPPMTRCFGTNFFSYVAHPMLMSLIHYKSGDLKAAKDYAAKVKALDWRKVTLDWLSRIEANRNKNSL